MSCFIIAANNIEILLLYKSDDEVNISFNAKDLIILSKCLSNDFNWKRFSRNENTLFYLKSTNTYESVEELVEKFEHDGLVCSEIDRIEQEIMMSEYSIENTQAPEYDDIVESYIVSDDQCLDIIKYLISTQSLGDIKSQLKKKQSIQDIKDILLNFI